jgi:diaminopimelate epimerase
MSDVARHSGLPFMKMHGLGNDFVVIDARVTARAVTAELRVRWRTATGVSASTSLR